MRFPFYSPEVQTTARVATSRHRDAYPKEDYRDEDVQRTLALAAGAIATLGMLPVAGLAHAAPLVGEAVAFPETGRYIADVPSANGTTMTMALTVDGDDVVVFATNGVDDEAYTAVPVTGNTTL